MNRQETVFTTVKALYEVTTIDLGKWMWENHVQWVANKALELSEKYQADIEKVYCAALLHDLGDVQYPRGHEDFNQWSLMKGEEILLSAGFSEADATEVLEEIVQPHSCRPDNLPETLEGKVLATADALFHLQTSFFPLFCYQRRPERVSSYEDWQDWFIEKVARDFHVKIFFEEERELARENFEALQKVFSNRTISSKGM